MNRKTEGYGDIMDRAVKAHVDGLTDGGVLWSGLLDYPDYIISEHGDVLSFVRKTPRKMAPARFGDYVGYFLKRRDGTLRKEYKHRLVAEVFHGPCPPGMECRHLDGDLQNCRFDNLLWGTRLENAQDRVRHGTSAAGIKNPQAVLSDERIVEMRRMRATTGATYKAIANIFGISTMTAYRAVVGQAWSHVR